MEFRMRLRKGNGEGVTKKGPMVAKHPPSSSTMSSSAATTTQPTATVGQAREVRSPMGPGPPNLGVPGHRRRGGSPDPRGGGGRRGGGHPSHHRDSPRTSPRSSPKNSPVRHTHRERSMSPGGRRTGVMGVRVGIMGRVNSRTTPSPPTPSSPPTKRPTPPTSPKIRRPQSPITPQGTTCRPTTPQSSSRRQQSLPVGVSSAGSIKSDSTTTFTGMKPRSSTVTMPRKVLSPTAPHPPSPITHGTTSHAKQGSNSGGGAKRPSSPTIVRPASPTITRPVSPTTTTTTTTRPVSPTTARPSSPGSGVRPPSPASSGGSKRPPSPRGTSPRGRGASPGARPPPISDEILQARVGRALRARLYLLHQPGPNSFTVAGDSPTHKYKVIIGPQTCSCGHGPYCVHVLFVMVRVLQLPHSHPTLMAGTLKDFEVEQMLRAWEDRRKKAVHCRERKMSGEMTVNGQIGSGIHGQSTPSSPHASTPQDTVSSEDESQCPICLNVMVEGESLVACESGCRNYLHHHCMAVWAADRHAQGQPLLCPLCRCPWPSKSSPPPRLPSNTAVHTHMSRQRSATSTTSTTQAPPPMPPYSSMSASFSGLTMNDAPSPSHSRTMSRSLNDTPSPSHSRIMNRPFSTTYSNPDSAYSSPGFDNNINSSVFGPTYPTVRGEISAAIVASASEEAVPLPRSEPIPEEHERTAATWVHVFGRELVSCLFSRDWVVRETGLRRLAHEVIKVLDWDSLVTGEQKRSHVTHCCANILAQVANDPVYKVYLACLRCLRALMSHLCPESSAEVDGLQELFRPLLHTLLLKCADGNRRTSQISVDSIMELCRGQEGELALATEAGGVGATYGLGGITFVLSCILNDSPPTEAPWQWLLGRLCVLDRLLDEFPNEFQLQMQPVDSGYKLQHYDRLMTVVEFAFKALGSSHATVSKLARRVYICGARMAASEPAVFHQVCDMLAKLDVSLQMRLKRRLRSMQGLQHGHGERRASLARLGDKLPLPPWESRSGGPRLVRSVSHSPSRMLSALRSSSQSPARQPVFTKTQTKKDVDVNRGNFSPSSNASPPRPTHLPLDSFETKFREKQAKLRLFHKTRPKQDTPLIVEHAFVSPTHHNQPWNSLKKSLYQQRPGLSHSYGDALDLSSPQTPLDSVNPPIYTFRDAVGTPDTPSAPFSTPVKELDLHSTILCDVNEKESTTLLDTSLPAIPDLDLVPPYLDENADPSEPREGCAYKEGSEWIKGPLLGTGAFSSCYQARDVRTGTIMAVKQVSFSRISEEEQERVEATIEEEILLMSRLRHHNIVRLLGATRLSTSFSVFTEWMAAGSVAAMLEKYGAFSEPVILNYTKQVLAGLAYLHSNTILHRDLKGANLLVDSTGQCLRIGDFGTAAQLASKSTVTGEFQGQLLGTIAFMAPEVLRGDDYGRACDVWSIGCCIIEMATTKPPWGADYVSNQYKLMFMIATSNGPPPVPETLSAPTQDLALRCLHINSENRPQAKDLLHHPCFKTHPP